ncbi:3-methyl-2-oxobutanoate hydroxymethyltransferase [candidate division MSBL1 archaeon SCGC-AAA261G05]|uniref:3-methyl-2-oxobutanoate hydroxymethyltransferase n=2 Tax=candidate division MSBL1 TaxID=215777 RepID=A0A133VSJ1_9EURY|nr:3-methyl-2-oxobutanoate hydroxymethyltransferase [candidate division MSBL1 archaeon SCGC-AAA261G05]KXB09414.1 3-methyl-2-oxobutanoate hydroxymethyltransferase [candidate division MSBL1 archaeon SCGC-AAA833K04]
MKGEKVTTITFQEMKDQGEQIVMLAAYDYPTARMIDEVGIDAILVGDSVSNVVLGYEDTLAVSMNEMIHHTKAVSRGVDRALVIGDMPFMSYQTSAEDAIRNAGRFLKDGGAEAVKVEGGRGVIDKIEAIIESGTPVMGHLGLTPQWIHQFGGFKIQGKTSEAAKLIVEDAKRLEQTGVFSIVLECVPRELSKIITGEVSVPTISCGAGPDCDGQVLVLHDILGLSGMTPKFAKKYVDLAPQIQEALANFREEVKARKFPTRNHSFKMEEKEIKSLKGYLSKSREAK